MAEYDGYSSCPRCGGEIHNPVAGQAKDGSGTIVDVWFCSQCASELRGLGRRQPAPTVPDTVEQLLAQWSGTNVCSPNDLLDDPVAQAKHAVGQWADKHPEEAASLAAEFRAMMDAEAGTQLNVDEFEDEA